MSYALKALIVVIYFHVSLCAVSAETLNLLELRLATTWPLEGYTKYEGDGVTRDYYLANLPVITDSMIETAEARGEPGQVYVQLNQQGAKILSEVTEKHVGRSLAIFVKGKLLTVPAIRAKITSGQLALKLTTPVEAQKFVARFPGQVKPVTSEPTESEIAKLNKKIDALIQVFEHPELQGAESILFTRAERKREDFEIEWERKRSFMARLSQEYHLPIFRYLKDKKPTFSRKGGVLQASFDISELGLEESGDHVKFRFIDNDWYFR